MNAESKQVATAVDPTLNPFGPVVAAPTGAAAQALIQREVTEVQSAMLIAKRFPRDVRVAMDRILQACTRPTLAEDALYEFPRGGEKVSGISIRLAEEIGRQWGNMICGVSELTRYGGQSEVMAYAWDLETGFRDEKRFTVRHWRDSRNGPGHAVSSERDIYEVVANMGARRKRACILAVVPIDVQEAAIKQVEMTLARHQEQVTPEKIKALLEAFTGFKVTKEMIEKRIQRRIESLTPQGLMQLRRIFASLKDQMSDVGDWFDAAPADKVTVTTPAATTGNEGLKQALGTRAGEDREPMYDEAIAVAKLKACTALAALEETWKAIRADFKGPPVRELTNPMHAAYTERKEALEQKAEADL